MIRAASEFSLDELAKAFNEGFEGYFVRFNETAATLSTRFRTEDVSLPHSLVFIDENRIVAFAYLARRGTRSRIAAMGVSPTYRGKGLGKTLLAALPLENCVLEVITENHSAIALYRRAGFEITRKLVGYEGPVQKGTAYLFEEGRGAQAPGVAWQMEEETLRKLGQEYFACRSGDAWLVATVAGKALVVRTVAGEARRLVHAVADRHGCNVIQTNVIFPEGLDLGLGVRSVAQYEMFSTGKR